MPPHIGKFASVISDVITGGVVSSKRRNLCSKISIGTIIDMFRHIAETTEPH